MKQTDSMIRERILDLKKERSVYIIAHYYQRPEIQDIADFVGVPMPWQWRPKRSPGYHSGGGSRFYGRISSYPVS